jgi:hypothetical protein
LELSRGLVVLQVGARLEKLSGRLLELMVCSEELGLTRGQSGGTFLLTSVKFEVLFKQCHVEAEKFRG